MGSHVCIRERTVVQEAIRGGHPICLLLIQKSN